jgi:CYTH domain-containing protein
MAKEIERKFKVVSDAWRDHAEPESTLIQQGYVTSDVSIRILKTVKEDYSQVVLDSGKPDGHYSFIPQLPDLLKIRDWSEFAKDSETLRLEEGKIETRIRIAEHKGITTSILAIKRYDPENRGNRDEHEFTVGNDLARELLGSHIITDRITKRRHIVTYKGYNFEVDEYVKPVRLVTSDLELPNMDEFNRVALPNWIGKDVTNDPDYTNRAIARTAPSVR